MVDVAVSPPGSGPGGVGPHARTPKRSYDSAFRAKAVERAKAPDVRLSAAAAELGVHPSTLRRWVKAHDAAGTDPPVPTDTDQAAPSAPSAPPPAPLGPTAPDKSAPDKTDPDAQRAPEPPAITVHHPGDDIFPSLSRLVPAYRFPIILVALLTAVAVSRVVPPDYVLRPAVVALHVLALVVSFGAVLVIDWHGLLWLAGRRGLSESTRLAAGAGPLIWGGLAGLIVSGALLHPNLSSPLTVTKLVLVLAVAWNGAAMSALRRRMARLPAYAKPRDLPRRDWRIMMAATTVSQLGWWGAILIGFVNSSR